MDSPDSSSASVPGTPPLPTLPSGFLGDHVIPESPNTQPIAAAPSNTSKNTKATSANVIRATESHGKYTHSHAAQLFLGKRVPLNTTKSNLCSLRAFCRFVGTHHCGINVEDITDNCECDQEDSCDHQTLFSLVRKYVFPNQAYGFLEFGYTSWTKDQLKHLRYYLIEFVVNNRSAKTVLSVKPSTLRGYLMGLQRSFSDLWGYQLRLLEGDIFTCPKEGLLAVIDNKFSHQQARGELVTSHNVLSSTELETLFASTLLSHSTPFGYQTRLVFGIGFITAMRPTAPATQCLSQFKKITVKGEDVWTITSVIGSRIGASKTNVGGLAAVRDKPTEICIWNRVLLNGNLNLYQDIDDYMVLRRSISCGTERIFLAANPRGKTIDSFFKRQHLGKNSFGRIIKDVCDKLSMTGCDHAEGFTANGLRGTVVTMVYEAGCGAAVVGQRTGHRDLRSLKSYHNLRGGIGQQQQDAIFGNASKKMKLKHGTEQERKGKENVMQTMESKADQIEKGSGESRSGAEASGPLLSRVQSMSRCNLPFHVHNHYR